MTSLQYAFLSLVYIQSVFACLNFTLPMKKVGLSLVFFHNWSIKSWIWFCFAILYHLLLRILLNRFHQMVIVRVLWTKSELLQSYLKIINWNSVDILTVPTRGEQAYLMFQAYPFSSRSVVAQYCLFCRSTPKDCLNQTQPKMMGSWVCSQVLL